MILDEKKRLPWMVGLEVPLEAEFLCGNQSFFPITNREEGREGAGRGLFSFVLKEIVCANCFQLTFDDSAYLWCIL